MWKNILIVLLVNIIVNVEATKKRVCVIGAGVCGLITVKSFSEYPNEFDPVVFEKNSDTGGLWIYTDSTTVDDHGLPVHSSMYNNLRTDSVKAEISIPDYVPFEGESDNMTFANREEVLQYLRNYTDDFNLRRYMQFNTNVEKIKPLPDLRWLIVMRNLNINKTIETTCEAVVVCNGLSKFAYEAYSIMYNCFLELIDDTIYRHNFKGYVPEIPGMKSFKGQVLHSHLYRRPEAYANQTVVLLGASYSGIDITVDISPFARKVYLSHRHDKLPSAFPSNVEQVPGVVGAEGGQLVLSNGSQISADVLIFCTGYLYDYPFLDESSGIVIEDGKRFHALYKYMFNIERPTMAFVDLPVINLVFRSAYAQIKYIREVLVGKLSLPSRERMLKEAERDLAKQPAGKGPCTNWDEFFDYFEEIVYEVDRKPIPWWLRPYIDASDNQSHWDPVNYKDKKLVLYQSNRTVAFVEAPDDHESQPSRSQRGAYLSVVTSIVCSSMIYLVSRRC